ncbi:MAG TPA: prepilin-type N-terminal cleavage/methylation domain-containing protein [Candidatus Angelobacter sp.]|nr:prepilin-type N-terminal cleavage/methylation domain-containing protein [Candidatus Angelobacter sp.]
MLVTIVVDTFVQMSKVSFQPEVPVRPRASGFSLVELLVVVMVILVITAIAIPSFVQARMKANEASAVNSMHTIQTAEFLYSEAYPDHGYAKKLADMGGDASDCKSPTPSSACLLMDGSLVAGYKSGYVFNIVSDNQTPSLSYTVNGTPEASGISGRCSFTATAGGQINIVVPGAGGTSRFASSGGSGCQ